MTPGPSRAGSVVVELGEGIGVAIVYTAADLDGAEIEIRRSSRSWTGQHSQVRPRHLGAEVRYAAVFDCLEAGRYQIRLRRRAGDLAPDGFGVSGGRVTSLQVAQAGLVAG
jgi:hypothetical protein